MTTKQEVIASVFDGCADDYDEVGFFTAFGRRLVELAGVGQAERVLDVASGRGACLFDAAERVGPAGLVHGVDLSESMVARLADDIRARGLANASARKMDAQALSFQPGSYDVVLCASALFLLPDPMAAAREFLRVLRPGGRCAVSLPTAPVRPETTPPVGEVYQRYGRRAGIPPAGLPRDMDLAALLGAAGFEDIQVTDEASTFRFRDADAWWRWSWTVAARHLYERLPAAQLELMREEVLELIETAVTDEGLPVTARLRYATARRPLGPAVS
jgi:O-methyltransferase / aklanonic acid methyltransferase